MPATEKTQNVMVGLLILSFFMIFVASLVISIPQASYEIAYGEESEEAESINVSRSAFTPTSSFVHLNESILSEQSNWYRTQYPSWNRSYFNRMISLPVLNVSQVTFKVSGHVVKGPLYISMRYYDFPNDANATVQTGEDFEIIQYGTPNDYSNEDIIGVFVSIDGLEWEVIDQLQFSVTVEFSEPKCPITIDLQRTNGDSLFLLPEFSAIQKRLARPSVVFGGEKYYLGLANQTLYLANGIYEVRIDWEMYEPNFGSVSITNESLIIIFRIKSVRLDVEATQRIPGVTVYINSQDNPDYSPFLLSSSPSFYLPPDLSKWVFVSGDPDSSRYPFHFSLILNTGSNHNITLTVNENWIVVGNIAFTPDRLVILIASLTIILIILILTRKEIKKSPVYLPFIFLFSAGLIPSYNITFIESYPRLLPLYSQYSESYSISMGFDISLSKVGDSISAVSGTGRFTPIWSQLFFALILLVFLGVVSEILRDDIGASPPDFVIGTPIIVFFVMQWVFSIVQVNVYTTSFSVGPFLSFLAVLCWYVQFRRSGGKVIETEIS